MNTNMCSLRELNLSSEEKPLADPTQVTPKQFFTTKIDNNQTF